MRIKSIAVVLLVAALAVLGFLFKGYQDQSALAEAASTRLAASNNRINQLNQQNEALESQNADNAASQASLKEAAAAAGLELPSRLNSNDILQDILALCDKHSVTAIPISANAWTPLVLQQRTYSVFKMTLNLKGTETHLIDCVQELQSQLYPTLKVESLLLTRGASDQDSSAALNITIYAR